MAASPQGRESNPDSKPELVIGLVGPVGTALYAVIKRLQAALSAYGYTPHTIKISDLIKFTYSNILNEGALPDSPLYKRTRGLMKAGDELRRKWDRKNTDGGAVAAYLAIQEIQRQRMQLFDGPKEGDASHSDDSVFPSKDGRAFILDSLKHPDEIRLLRRTYGNALVIISVYSPMQKCQKRLARKMMQEGSGYRVEDYIDKAKKLINHDDQGGDDGLGQNVRDAFPLADAFISETGDINNQIQRIIEICFGHPYRTPTLDEQGMYFAYSASLRSADLSRQVGAVITDTSSDGDGEILATGCNEVPKPGGGAPWADTESLDGSEDDYRDYQRQQDSNATAKRENLAELFKLLSKNGWLDSQYHNKNPDDLAKIAIDKKGPLKGARICNVLEYGRPVHAEMFAITQAAKKGVSVRHATMYCTTFPCHMCAGHIVAAGLRQVIYIQPYPKSLVTEQYGSIISVAGEGNDPHSMVKFDPFIGIAPYRYQQFFQDGKRKDSLGYARVPWDPAITDYRFGQPFPSGYFDLETWYLKRLADFLEHSTKQSHALDQILIMAKSRTNSWPELKREAMEESFLRNM